jgi:hypothetical protein
MPCTHLVPPSLVRSLAPGWTAGWRTARAACLVAVLGLGCSSHPPPPADPQLKLSVPEAKGSPTTSTETRPLRFSEEAAARGVVFTPVNGEEAGNLAILESLGSGLAVLDVDRDGDLDLFAVGGGRFHDNSTEPMAVADALFANDGTGRFQVITRAAGIEQGSFYAHGVEVGDFDSDGFSDLLVTGFHGLRFLSNLGDGTFREVPPDEHGISGDGWHSSAAAADFNGDGHLDLYLVRYVDWSPDNHPACVVQGHRDVCPPGEFEGVSDRLWLSDGQGAFRDASQETGLVDGGKGLGVVAADVDLDGDTDLYVANDTTANRLYRNGGDGTLAECGLVAGVAMGETGAPEGSMGTDIADANMDGLPDIWVANFENQSFGLYRNFGGASFEHASGVAGITAVGAVYVGFGTMFLDVDLDGAEDLFVANGHVMQFPTLTPLKQRPLLFHNLGSGRFANVAEGAGAYFQTGHLGRGAATGDLDGDGDEDLVVSQTNEPLAVLLNETSAAPRGLTLELVGTQANRDAIGATATLETNRRSLLRQVTAGGSYLSASSRVLTWGLEEGEQPRAMTIRWPHGGETRLPWEAATGRFLLLEGGVSPSMLPRSGRPNAGSDAQKR